MEKIIDQKNNLSNLEWSALVAQASDSWSDFTSEGTKDVFNAQGFEMATTPLSSGALPINEFVNTIIRIALNKVNVANVKDLLSDVVEVYENAEGGIMQRMAVEPIDPISPQFKGLADFSVNSPFIHRKPKTKERFFKQNFDFQNVISIQRFQLKQAFLNEYGMGNWLAGVMQQLTNSYTKQKALNRLEALNHGLNPSVLNLKNEQIVNVTLSQTPSDAELRNAIKTIKDTVAQMVDVIDTDKFNSYGLHKAVGVDDLVLLVRPEFTNELETTTLYGAFNKEMLETGLKTIKLPNFGGLVPMKNDQELVLTYDDWGICTNKNEITSYKDVNENVFAVIIEKGALWESVQNGFSVTPAPYNPRTEETTYWANGINNGIYFDHAYNLVKIQKTS